MKKVLIDDPLELHSMKLLSMLILSFIGGALLYSILQFLVEPDFLPAFIWINGCNAILGFAFFLNKNGRYREAKILTLVCISAAILLATQLGPPAVYSRYLYGMIIPVVLGSILLSLRGTMLLALANLAAVLILVALSPYITIAAVIDPLGIYITVSLLILVGVHHNSRMEDNRQIEIIQKEERYRSLVENIGEVIFSLDIDGYITYMSPVVERVTQFKAEELVGKHFSELVHDEDLPELKKSLERLYSGIEEASEFRLIDRDKNQLHVRTTSHLVTENGVPIGITGVATDITQQKRLETQFLQSQKMETLGRLAGGIAHDFNNLLTVILGYCQMLTMEDTLPPGIDDLVKSIQTAADRGAGLIRQLLAFSRKQIIQPRVLDINQCLDNLETILKRLIRENITFTTVYATGIRSIKVDPAQLEQVIMNLAVNAVDAMPGGGSLKIETADICLDDAYCRQYNDVEPGNYVVLSVIDTGCGMDKKTREYLFDPFYTTKEAGKGTGLGLSTVYGIVKQSGGHIRFDSSPGKGTVFKIYFPGIDEAGEKDVEEENKTKPVVEKRKELLLVVEDEVELRDVMVRVLEGYGYRAFAAKDGETALRMCEELKDEKVDLLITDVMMPGISGRDLAAKLKKLFPGMGVLYVSGYTDRKIVTSDIVGKGMTFLPKPFTPGLLQFRIREVLGKGEVPDDDKSEARSTPVEKG